MPDHKPENLEGNRALPRDIESLRDAKSLFLSLVNSIPACFLRKDREGRIVFVNNNFATLFGKRAEEIMGKTLADFYDAEFADEAREEDEQVMQSGEVLEDVFEDTIDGKLHYYASRKGPVRNEQGEVIGIQSIFWDITEQRNAEQALLNEREELREAKKVADEANRAKSDFLANMSHEIRTPMNAIIGMTDLLLETQLTPTQHEYLQMIQDSGEALLGLLNDILDFSKIEAGKLELESTTFDIRESLGDLMKGLGLRAHDKGLELAFRVDKQIPRHLRGDPGRIRQVIVNLVGNAIKFTEQGEVILEIDCQELSDDTATLRFSVIDTGIGISEENHTKIFSEFEQADASTTRKFGGTGLGLAISSRLVQLMNGRIWLESEVGKGSKFLFDLPLEIDHAQPTSEQSGSPVNVQGVRVLIVDDNATNRRILKDMLTNWGMNPATSSGGALALRSLADAKEEGDDFKLLISDVNMPDIDGLSLARSIVDESLLDPASVIMLTSGARPDDAENLRTLGITNHLLKPVKQSEIYDAVVSSLSAVGVAATLQPIVEETKGAACSSLDELQILLAEDNLVNQKLALGILEKLGHRVTVANNGMEALEQLEEQEFDLVLMDVQMPEMDGLSATRELRRRELHKGRHVPIVAMTAHAMKGDRERCLAAGMDDYLCKPIRLKDVSDKLSELFADTNAPEDRTVHQETKDGPQSDGIVWSAVLESLGGDDAMLRDLIEVFLDDTPGLMARADEAADHDDSDALRATAHSLKGSLLFLNPETAIRCAQELEQQAAEGNMENARRSLGEFKSHYGAICENLQAYMKNSR